MPVKLGEVNTNGCSGDKPWPLLEVATGKKVACGGPSKADAMKALQVRNMAHAGIPVGKGELGMYVTTTGVQVIEQDRDWIEKAIGEGMGRGGPRQGVGGTDLCVCPTCGETAKHERGTPCVEQKCPKCGIAMEGKAP